MKRSTTDAAQPTRKSRAKIDLAWGKVLQGDIRRIEIHPLLCAQFPKLTKTDLKISVLLCESLASWQIGDLLGISEHTVENHRSRIHKKLQIPASHNLSTFFIGCLY